MKRYATEFRQGKCIIKEFNWSFTKDANRSYAYGDIGDAADEMEEMNKIVGYYEELRLANCN